VNIEPFLYWIREREAIRLKRAAGAAPPWTTDPILGTYRFCNVRREDDRVTIWIRQNIREPYADHPHLWWMLCAARIINWPDTLQELIEGSCSWPTAPGFNPARISEIMQARMDRGKKVFTGSYMIRAESDKHCAWFSWSKQRYIGEIVLGRLWEHRSEISATMKQRNSVKATHEHISQFRGWGPFMTWQAVADMIYCPALLGKAADRDSWAAAGPGTLRGLNRLYERPVKQPLSQDQALEELLNLYPKLKAITNIDFPDVLNICCETDKYIRVLNNEGRPRALYRA
jgi:hypothetical protein